MPDSFESIERLVKRLPKFWIEYRPDYCEWILHFGVKGKQEVWVTCFSDEFVLLAVRGLAKIDLGKQLEWNARNLLRNYIETFAPNADEDWIELMSASPDRGKKE